MKKLNMRIAKQGIKLSNGAELIPFADVVDKNFFDFFKKHCYIDSNVRNSFIKLEEDFKATCDLYILKNKGNKMFHNLILMPIGYSIKENSGFSFAFVILNKRSRKQAYEIKNFFKNGGVYKPSIQNISQGV